MYVVESDVEEAHHLLIDAHQSLLLLIDLQSKLAPAIDQAKTRLARCSLLLTAARKLNVPVIATEHCPNRVGPTVPSIKQALEAREVIEKRHFNGMSETSLSDAVAYHARKTIVVAGMEAHVCVLQTVSGLLTAGYAPLVVADAVGSREPTSRDLAISRMRHHGVDIVTVEMVLFEWLKAGDTDAFKSLLPMIKSGRAD